MKSKVLIFVCVTLVSFFACKPSSSNQESSSKMKPVSFERAHNYFVHNDVIFESGKITSQEEFDQLFSPAVTMGEEGKATPIDFSKKFVIAIVEPITYHLTEVKPVLLECDEDHLYFSYRVKVGAEQSFTITPQLILIVDKEFDKNLVLKRLD